MQERLGAVAGAVAAELEALQGGLQRRAEVAAARAMLDLMQDTAHVMSKVIWRTSAGAFDLAHRCRRLQERSSQNSRQVDAQHHCVAMYVASSFILASNQVLPASQVEKLLDEVEAASPNAGSGSGADLDARVRLYERVASKVSRLQFYAARGSGLPFVVMLQPRMDAATAALEVSHCFAISIMLYLSARAKSMFILESHTRCGRLRRAVPPHRCTFGMQSSVQLPFASLLCCRHVWGRACPRHWRREGPRQSATRCTPTPLSAAARRRRPWCGGQWSRRLWQKH